MFHCSIVLLTSKNSMCIFSCPFKMSQCGDSGAIAYLKFCLLDFSCRKRKNEHIKLLSIRCENLKGSGDTQVCYPVLFGELRNIYFDSVMQSFSAVLPGTRQVYIVQKCCQMGQDIQLEANFTHDITQTSWTLFLFVTVEDYQRRGKKITGV